MAHILVVDDRPVNRQLLVTLLGYYGHTLAEAGDGVSALVLIAQQRPDLIITDLLMPNMDGEELCWRLRADPATASVPIIIHTASYRTRQARQIADRVGVRWVLHKPSEPVEILAVVAEALGTIARPVAPATSPAPLTTTAPGAYDGDSPDTPPGRAPRGNQRLSQLLEESADIAHYQSTPLTPADFVQDARSLAMRLTSLVNVGLQMSRERDPDKLVDLFCAAAQDILSARYVGVVILAPQGGVRKFCSRGLGQAVHDEVAASIANCPAAMRVLGEPGQTRMLLASREGDFTGLPVAHPAVRSLLACPAMGLDAPCGWLYAADRLGDEGFGPDDERLLLALGAELATAWGSIMMLDELDRRVAERTRELEAVNLELEAFSVLVSHDLRAPLGSIDGFSKALVQEFQNVLPPDAMRYLGNIERNVGVMTRLIEDLLKFARASRTGLEMDAVDLAPLVRDCLATFADEIARRAVVVTVGPLPVCRADPALLMQVLLNLVGNALKYSRRQPLPRIEIGSRLVNSEHLVYVRDNGTGFDMQAAAGLFAPFQRLHAATEFEGTGIGLALVKRVIGRHGGRVWADSVPGQGASFFFTLPTDPPARERGAAG